MPSLASYIGQQVTRYSFLVKRGKDYYNLFTVMECIFPDMQDYEHFPAKDGHPFCAFDHKADGDADKVFLSVDRTVLTEDMIREPWDNTSIDGCRISTDMKDYRWATGADKYFVIPLHDEHKGRSELVEILPKRRTSAYVNYCLPVDIQNCEVLKSMQGNEKLLKQIRNLSTEHLGFDLTLHSRFYGSFIFVSHNTIYSHLDFTEDAEEPGLYCRVHYRAGKKSPLKFVIKAFSPEGQLLDTYVRKNADCRFLNHFTFDTRFHSLDIDVFDSDDLLIDYYKHMVFIHRFNIDINVAEKKVRYIDEKGGERIVEKYSTAAKDIIGVKDIATLFGTSEEYTYDKFEKSLDFVFFDGDKEQEEANRQKAVDCVVRILNSAQEKCYIGDVFFNNKSFVDFITPVAKLDLDIRILTSKEKNNGPELDDLKKTIDLHNEKLGTNIHCRKMKGTAALHDRFVIADDRMWMLGCSLNEYGVRATTLIRVPQEYAGKIIKTVEEWWRNEEVMEDL